MFYVSLHGIDLVDSFVRGVRLCLCVDVYLCTRTCVCVSVCLSLSISVCVRAQRCCVSFSERFPSPSVDVKNGGKKTSSRSGAQKANVRSSDRKKGKKRRETGRAETNAGLEEGQE